MMRGQKRTLKISPAQQFVGFHISFKVGGCDNVNVPTG